MDGSYIINLDEYESIGTQWIALYVNCNNVTYFVSFEVKDIPKEIIKFIRNKNNITNIYRIQAYDSIIYGYFWTGFIHFMLTGKSFIRAYKFVFCKWLWKDRKNNIKVFLIIKNEKMILCYLWQL